LVPAFEGIERRVEEMSQANASYEEDAGGEEKSTQVEGESSSMPQAPASGLPDEKTLRDAVSAVARSEVSSALGDMNLKSVMDTQLEDLARNFQDKLEKSISDRLLSTVSESLQPRLDEANRTIDSSSENAIKRISSAVQSHLADAKREHDSTLQASLERATASVQSRVSESVTEMEEKFRSYTAKLAEEKKTALAEMTQSSNDLWPRFDRTMQQVSKDRAEVSEIHDKTVALGDSLRSQVQEFQKVSKSVSQLSEVAKNASNNCEAILARLKPLVDNEAPTGSTSVSPDTSEALSRMEKSMTKVTSENTTLRDQVTSLASRLQEMEAQFDRRLSSAVADFQGASQSVPAIRVEERVLPKDFAKLLFLGSIVLILLAQLFVHQPPEYVSSFM
jgi:predicted  nucleic acid-binding Zn-ribbon protein